jgi:hypothetical protein
LPVEYDTRDETVTFSERCEHNVDAVYNNNRHSPYPIKVLKTVIVAHAGISVQRMSEVLPAAAAQNATAAAATQRVSIVIGG